MSIMRRLLFLVLALPVAGFGVEPIQPKVEPPSFARIIVPGAPLKSPDKPEIIRPDLALQLSVPKTVILPARSLVIQAPAPKIIIAARPLSQAEAARQTLPAQEELRKMADALTPSSNAVNPSEEQARRDGALDAVFDGMRDPDVAAWDGLSREFARGPLSPALPRVETAARSLLARLLPRFYHRIPVTSVCYGGERSGHAWTPQTGHIIHLVPAKADSQGEVASAFGLPDAARVQQKIEHLMAYAHEYFHVLFDSAVHRPEAYPLRSVYSAMTEGFAVSGEQLLFERLIDQAPMLGLTPRDVLDLSSMLQARQKWLAATDTHYSEGSLSWQKAYADGGEAGLLAFLAFLDARRMIATSRADPVYQLVLGDWKLLSAYLGDDAAVPARRGLEAFGKAARGEALSDEEKREAAVVVEQAGAPGWRRLFERTLLADKHIWEPRSGARGEHWWEKAVQPIVPVDPVFALAQLSSAAAAELARFLVETVQAPGGATRLFNRPGPKEKFSGSNKKFEAVTAGAAMLPWNEADLKTWTDGLMRWLSAQR